jgi:hypothetical protein
MQATFINTRRIAYDLYACSAKIHLEGNGILKTRGCFKDNAKLSEPLTSTPLWYVMSYA